MDIGLSTIFPNTGLDRTAETTDRFPIRVHLFLRWFLNTNNNNNKKPKGICFYYLFFPQTRYAKSATSVDRAAASFILV